MITNYYIIPGILPPPLPTEGELSLYNILEMAAVAYGVDMNEVTQKNRRTECVFARHAYCMMARKLTTKPLTAIGRIINRDHATVIHSCRIAEVLIETRYGDFPQKYEYLKELLK
jgi:chromosomal replication initiation ATPase DnaA